jgi:hypothetical protein
MDGDRIEKATVVADHMEHPNGVRIRGGHLYVTQSTLANVPARMGSWSAASTASA